MNTETITIGDYTVFMIWGEDREAAAYYFKEQHLCKTWDEFAFDCPYMNEILTRVQDAQNYFEISIKDSFQP